MKKWIAAIALAATSTAWAVDLTGDVTVAINYTPGCQLTITKSQVDFDYTAFVGGTVDPATFSVQCSSGINPDVKLQVKNDSNSRVGALQFITVSDQALMLPYRVFFQDLGSGNYAVNAGQTASTNQTGCPSNAATCSNTGSTNNAFEVVVSY